jgi:hypothetical protein
MSPRRKPWGITYARAVRGHLATVEARHHRTIRDGIEEQLRHEPAVETRNRKPLEPSAVFGGELWELRFGPANELRLFYRIDEDAHEVLVVAIGIKIRDRLRIGGREVEL